jgi:hypothetical protein
MWFNNISLATTAGLGCIGYLVYCKIYDKNIISEHKQIVKNYKKHVSDLITKGPTYNHRWSALHIGAILGFCGVSSYVIYHTRISSNNNCFLHMMFLPHFASEHQAKIFKGPDGVFEFLVITMASSIVGGIATSIGTLGLYLYSPYVILSSPFLVPLTVDRLIMPYLYPIIFNPSVSSSSSSLSSSLSSSSLSLPYLSTSYSWHNKLNGLALAIMYISDLKNDEKQIEPKHLLYGTGLYYLGTVNPFIGCVTLGLLTEYLVINQDKLDD